MNCRKKIFATLTFCLLGCFLYGQQEPIFTVAQLQEDMQYVRSSLQTKHPNLYLYTTKNELDKVFDSLTNNMPGPMTALAFYKHITILSSIIKDGHTVMLPGKKTTDYHNSNSKFLPYKFFIANNRLYVDMVCTADSTVVRNDEVLSINNIASAQIIETLVNRLVRDGYNLTYPYWILNNYFKAYYSFIFGHPGQFEIKYTHDEAVKTAMVNALPNDSIAYFRKLKYPERTLEKRPGEGITLQLSPENKYAVLTIKDFHNDVLKRDYKQNFTAVIGEYFKQINDSKTDNLIVDIRDNQGGDIPNGAELLSYLLDKPFTIVEAYYEVDNSENGFQLKKTTGQSLGMHKPKDNVYKGKLFVLTNGGSFSNSGIVASCLKRNNRAVFIGEETGGNNKVLAGYTKDHYLPNTGIEVQIPVKQFMLAENLPLTGRGTMPDFRVLQTWQGSKDNIDMVMKYAIDKIMQGK